MSQSSGQVHPISIVIMSGIVIALVGVAYFWGVPLIEKRTTITEVTSAQMFISEMNKKLTDLVKTGAGRAEIDVPKNFIKFIPSNSVDAENNLFIMEFFVDQPMIYPDATIYPDYVSCMNPEEGPISTPDFATCVGTHGVASPEIVSLNEVTEADGERYLMRMKLHYRELDTDEKGYKIVLCPAGDADCEAQRTGKSRITLTFNRNVVLTNSAENGGDLVATYIDVDVI